MVRHWGLESPAWLWLAFLFLTTAVPSFAQRPASRTTGGAASSSTPAPTARGTSSGARRQQARTRVAVEGFSGPRASHLRSLVIANLEENNFEVVGGDELERAKREANVDGALNTAEEYLEVARAGRIDAFVSGHVGRQRRSWSLGLRVRNGETGQPLGGASWGGRTTSAMDGVRRNCSERLWDYFGEARAPAQISAREREERARREREARAAEEREAAEAERREREAEDQRRREEESARQERERRAADDRRDDRYDDRRDDRYDDRRDDRGDDRYDDPREDRNDDRYDDRRDDRRSSRRGDRSEDRYDDRRDDRNDDRRSTRDRRDERNDERRSDRRRRGDDCDPRYDRDCDEDEEEEEAEEELTEADTRYDSFRLAIATGSLYRDFGGRASVYARRREPAPGALDENTVLEDRRYSSAGIGHAELGVDAEIYPGAFDAQTFPYLGFFGSFRHSLFLSANGVCREALQCQAGDGNTLVSANSIEMLLGARLRYRFGRNRRDFEAFLDGAYHYHAFNFDLEGLAKLTYQGIVAPMEYQGVSVGAGFNYGMVPRYLFLGVRMDYRIGLALGVNARNVWGVNSTYDNGLHLGVDLKHEVSWLDPNLFVTLRLEYFFFQTRFRGQTGCYTPAAPGGRCQENPPWETDTESGGPNLWERWPVRPGSTDYYLDENVTGYGGFESPVFDHYFRLGIQIGYAFR